MLTGSIQSVIEDGSHQQDSKEAVDNLTATEKAVDQQSIRTARNLVRVFSLEDKLKQQLSLSQDEFRSKIAQLLIEVS